MKRIHFILLLISFFSSTISCTIGRGNDLKEREYRGIIVDIYRIFNRNALTFLVRTEKYGEFEVLADSWYPSSQFASIGDSIIKHSGELKLTIKKKDGSSRVFEYW